MFEVKPHKTIVKNLHRIVANSHSILNDGDNDILYTGTNIYGNRILGAIVFEDDEIGYLRYFHTLITDNVYNSFINKRVSLRDVLQNAESFFIVDKKYNDEEIDFNLISFNEVPNDYLPLPDSFCPELLKEASLDYSFSLKGGISDLHKVEPDVMSAVNIHFCSFLKSSSAFLKQLNITPVIYSEVAAAGSFELNFKIEFKEIKDLFYKPNNDIKNFLPRLYNYILDLLPKEAAGVLKADKIESINFKNIENELKQIFDVRNIHAQEKDIEQKVIDIISYSVENLKEIEYKGFDRVEMLNHVKEGEKVPIALINQGYYESVENKFFKPENLIKPDIIEYDDFPKDYSIQVYSLNKESGNGGIYLTIDNGIKKVALHLRGRPDYHDTIFTKNMDDDKIIVIQAIAKRVNGLVTELTYTF